MSDAKIDSRSDALAIVEHLRANGHVAYFAGGCVRDTLLGLTPKDFDVATDAPPDRVRQLFKNTQAVGAAFGVILVRQGKSTIEVATFRTDDKYEDGRRPTAVHFTTAEEDAKRRDFTINGLFFDPVENKVIDYVGGQEDLKNKILRAIGDPNQRFEEDHLRLLRAVRFAARFFMDEFRIEEKTADAMLRHADQLKRISPERIAEELRLILPPPSREWAWEFLRQFNLIQVIFRHLPDQPPSEWRFSRTMLFVRVAPEQPISIGLGLGALVLDYRFECLPAGSNILDILTKDEVRRAVQALRTALKISNEEADHAAGVLTVIHLLDEQKPTVAIMKRFLALPTSSDSRALLWAMLNGNLHRDRINWLEKQFRELEKSDFAPPPLITGDDLVAAGLSPGPVFKRVLDMTYDEQLENRIATRDAAMKFALSMFIA